MRSVSSFGKTKVAGWLGSSSFREIDRQCALLLWRRFNTDDLVAFSGALVSAMSAQGHSCIRIHELAGKPWGREGNELKSLPQKEEWMSALSSSEAVSGPEGKAPLILDGNRLYLHRYFLHETKVAGQIHRLSQPLEENLHPETILMAKRLLKEKNELSSTGGNLQAAAALLPFFSQLSIISGGPGTGKTTVLTKALALFAKNALAHKKPLPRFRVAAPTGKAAQRMGESIRNAMKDVEDANVIEHLRSIEPSTVHRLLEIPGYSPTPRRNAKNPIEADIVVIDETSMMDITLFARLLEAIKPKARLILLGDRAQLASVEVGAVLADICNVFEKNSFTKEFAETVNGVVGEKENRVAAASGVETLSPLIELRHNYRFAGTRPIGLVSANIREGNVEEALRALKAEPAVDEYCSIAPYPGREELSRILMENYAPLLEAKNPEDALERVEKFMTLTALNEGLFGRIGINQLVYTAYGKPLPVRPIKIVENSPRHQLFNGDMGIIIQNRSVKGHGYAWFPAIPNKESSENSVIVTEKVRSFLIGALPMYVDAFAITIHNSQGSEFEQVAVVLPERENQIMTRELLYTAVTRARKKVQVYETEEIFKNSIGRLAERMSGLTERLTNLMGSGGKSNESDRKSLKKSKK